MSAALVRLMTASRARDARACRRRHYLRYTLGYRSAEDAHSLRFGTLLHLMLEAWWMAVKRGDSVDIWLYAAQEILAEQQVDIIDRLKLQVLLTGYHFRWADEAAFYEVLGVELQFEGPLVNPVTGRQSQLWKLAGKLDVLVRDRRDGLVRVVEHKSSSEDVSAGSDYWRRLKMDGQVSVYFEGGRILGHEVYAVLYDVIGKLRHDFVQVPLLDELGNKIVHNAQGERVRTGAGKWRQTGDKDQGFTLQTRLETPEEFQQRIAGVIAEAPEKYFTRGEVHRLEQELADGITDVWQLGQSLRDEEIAERFPRNPDACMQPGRTCPFFAACAGEASLDDQRLYVRSDVVHPELEAA
ncbi:MAG: PD-(D/E)XK nuclease family protein [Archangium sp.]|nr:PD-(D/E)XK nuclease family protein [Archangium sp.]